LKTFPGKVRCTADPSAALGACDFFDLFVFSADQLVVFKAADKAIILSGAEGTSAAFN
jgi:hypothetical protein